MAGTRKRLSPAGGRYDPDVIAARVESTRARHQIPVKEIAGAIWPHQDEPRFTWYKKTNRRDSEFDNAELGLIADYFSRRLSKKLIGWPFIDEDLSDLLEPK